MAVAYFLLIMKNILLFVAFFTFHIYGQAKDLLVINSNTPHVTNNNYSLYHDSETNHDKACYKDLKSDVYFSTNTYVYKVKALLNTSMVEYYEEWGDSLFSKIEIECVNLRNQKIRTYEFINDCQWSRFNYWSFAGYTDTPWFDNDRAICKVVKVGYGCNAIIMRGFRDSIDPEELTIFSVYDDQVKLVFHEHIAINKMQTTDDGRTVYELVKVVYPDNTDDILYENYSLCFGDGKITIDRTK